jgi:hypothetical protein
MFKLIEGEQIVMAAVDPQPQQGWKPPALPHDLQLQSDSDSTMLAWTSSPLLMVVLVLLVAIVIGLVYIARLRRQRTTTTPGYPSPAVGYGPPVGSQGHPLVACGACGNPISPAAVQCPRCGHPSRPANG